MDMSEMPLDSKQQTMMWQQNTYLADSGIQSGATTQVNKTTYQGLSQDLETGCPKLTIVNFRVF